MKITDKELKELKNYAENVHTDFDLNSAIARSSAYTAIETVNQLRVSTRNNILFTLLGGLISFMVVISSDLIRAKESKKELEELNIQLLEMKTQLTNFQKHHSKKYSLQTSLKN